MFNVTGETYAIPFLENIKIVFFLTKLDKGIISESTNLVTKILKLCPDYEIQISTLKPMKQPFKL